MNHFTSEQLKTPAWELHLKTPLSVLEQYYIDTILVYRQPIFTEKELNTNIDNLIWKPLRDFLKTDIVEQSTNIHSNENKPLFVREGFLFDPKFMELDETISFDILPENDYDSHPLVSSFTPLRTLNEASDKERYPSLQPARPGTKGAADIYDVSNIKDSVDIDTLSTKDLEVSWENNRPETIFKPSKSFKPVKKVKKSLNWIKLTINLLLFVVSLSIGIMLGQYLIHILYDKLLLK